MGSLVSKDESLPDTKPRTRDRVYTDVEGIKVYVIQGNVFQEHADVLIWGIGRSLDLNKSRSSQALLNAAGDTLQTEIKKKYPGGLTSGNIAVVNAGSLNCKEIYFISLEKWKEQVTQQNVLWNIIWECLSTANKSNFVSIITPAIGSGFLGYPVNVVANSMFECIKKFSQKHPDTTLKIVTIVTRDTETYNMYKEHARSIACPGSGASKTCVQGNVSVKIYTGALADWRADVLVCSCSSDLNLSNGGLAQSILHKAGSKLQDECNLNYPHGIQKEQVAVAKGYNLHCKKVYFGTLSSWSGDGSSCKKELAVFVCECLKLAHKYNMQSVAFPALGTGSLKYPPQVSASIIHICVEDFCKQNPSSKLLIYVVVYDGSSDGKTVKQAFDQEWASNAGKLLVIQAPIHQPQPLLPPQVPAAPKPKPSRKDTKEYFAYMYKSDPKTPKYWEKFHHKKTVKEWNGSKGDLSLKIFQVTGSAFSDIIQLVNDTLKEQPSSNFTSIKVKEVQRLENLQLFDKYANYRHSQFPKVSKGGKLTPLENIKACKTGQPLTLKNTKRGCILDQDIYPEVNELYLFHGTKAVTLDGIFQQSLDNRLAGKGRFGNGIYCAETPAKSNNYTDQTGEKKMFLVRACLGEIYIHDGRTYEFKRAPCKACQKDQCYCGKPMYDSIVAEGALPYREFIFHDRCLVYPEYLITYTCS
ncbi:hypothetical protein CHS0354_030476 [Potamilus streckersoni]|uniref:Poly [ADP-ribose] polymerase n=1 Tax=Potamilus streckersoni TaxID=2493646 RepID=A0AAE0RPM6_9BIVA|nr:hypothetical protein CHS0354_030476 [Potamilus streckersoni]